MRKSNTKTSRSNWVSFQLSRNAGNCESGSTDFSRAILKLAELDGIRGFEGLAERALRYTQSTGEDCVYIHRELVNNYLEEAQGYDESDREHNCEHNCQDDCSTCQNHTRHDCYVRIEQYNFLTQGMTANWKCGHDCSDTEEDCELANTEEDTEANCVHDCETSCLTCSYHNDEGMHDCMTHSRHGSDCGHDCYDSGCYDNSFDEKTELYQTLNQYSSEWNTAEQYVEQVSRLHTKYLTEEQITFMSDNFQFSERYYDPMYKVWNLAYTENHSVLPAMTSKLPRLVCTSSQERIAISDLTSIQHGMLMANSVERQNAIAFLLTAQSCGIYNNDAPFVTYGLKTMLKGIQAHGLEFATNPHHIISQLLDTHDSEGYVERLSYVLYNVFNRGYLADLTNLLNNIVFDYSTQREIAHTVDYQRVLDYLRTEQSYTGSQASKPHRLLNAMRVMVDYKASVLHPYYHMVMTLAQNHTSVEIYGAHCDFRKVINSSEFRQSLETYLGLAIKSEPAIAEPAKSNCLCGNPDCEGIAQPIISG